LVAVQSVCVNIEQPWLRGLEIAFDPSIVQDCSGPVIPVVAAAVV